MPPFWKRDDPAPRPQPQADDTPEALQRKASDLVTFVNLNAGKLPVPSTVIALHVVDTVREVIASVDGEELDVHVSVTLVGILDDYLPTTLRSYLALDPAVTDTVRPSGRTPRTALREQLEALWLAATDVLAASRDRDADALMTQGSFLRTKFSGSDLDL